MRLDHAITLPHLPSTNTDKTQIYHDQIEAKQRELEPWTTQINEKQAALDISSGERKLLVTKVDTLKQALLGSEEAMSNLKADKVLKVGLAILASVLIC